MTNQKIFRWRLFFHGAVLVMEYIAKNGEVQI